MLSVTARKLAALCLCLASGTSAAENKTINDPEVVYRYWGQLSVYQDNPENYFGVHQVGLPDGCQVESVHVLQRHAQRFPIGDTGDFAQKLSNLTRAKDGSRGFSGPLDFLNTYTYILNDTGLLTNIGAGAEFARGATFWNRYGRTVFNASVGQKAYDPNFRNGTARPKVTLRTTGQSRIVNSEINWALGFFGPSFNTTPDQTLDHWDAPFRVVTIPEGGTENNTLASYDSCFNDNNQDVLDMAQNHVTNWVNIYANSTARRLQRYAPKGFQLSSAEVFNMQNICAYEYAYIGMSDFCTLFTEQEWRDFERALDIEYYYDYSYGNPTGRAQGIGYVQELLARIQHEHISSSNSSVNSTLDNNPKTFPLGQKIYPDFSHDDIIISLLPPMSVDYFKDPPSLKADRPSSHNHRFNLAHLTPFGANLVTEQIGCSSPDPSPVRRPRVQYTPTQYGYDPANATHKFVRMRLNNGILPLHSIRGGACGDNDKGGRKDGLCELGAFLSSQKDSYQRSNYDYACFGNYTVPITTEGIDYDGAVVKGRRYNQVHGRAR